MFAKSTPDNVVVVSGRIEGDDAAVAPKLGGRILEIRVREGDSVKAGDVIAVLDDDQVRAREDQARAALTQAEARARAARDQIAVLQEQLRQAQLQTEQSKVDASGPRPAGGSRPGRGRRRSSRSSRRPISSRCSTRTPTRSSRRPARCRNVRPSWPSRRPTSRRRAVAAAQRRVDAAQGALTTAQGQPDQSGHSRSRNADGAQAARAAGDRGGERHGADRTGARATGRGAGEPQDLTIRAPFAGTIVTRSAEPGEVVGAGTPIVTLVDLSRVYLRGFVPEGRIGAVKVGQPARVYLDSNPNAADRRVGVADRSAGDLHAGEHLLPRRPRQAGRRRQAAAQGRRRLREAGHAGRRRDSGRRRRLAERAAVT